MGAWFAGLFKSRRRTPAPAPPEAPPAEPEEDPQTKADREFAEDAAEGARWLAEAIKRNGGYFFPSDMRPRDDADDGRSRFGRRGFFRWKS